MRVAAAGVLLALVAVGTLLATESPAHHRRAAVSHGAPAQARRRAVVAGRRRRAASGTVRPRDAHRTLARVRILAQGGLHRRDVALTFDDGPGPYTLAILRQLQRLHVHATFFVIGRWAQRYPRLVRREVAAGETVGDHTYSHAALAALPPAGQAQQIDQGAAALRAAGAPAPLLLRPPYGSFDAATLALAAARHMVTVLWTVDTRDFSRPGVARIAYAALSGARPGEIVLMHDGGGDRSQTLAALPRIVRALRRRHLHLVTLAKLLARDPPARGQLPPPGLAR